MSKTVKGKYDELSETFGFHDWNLTAKQKFDNLINEMIKEAIALATKEYECSAWFEWANSANAKVDNPTSIYVGLPLGEEELDSPVWSFKLEDLVNRAIEYNDEKDNSEHQQVLTGIRDGLAAQVKRLDEAIAKLK